MSDGVDHEQLQSPSPGEVLHLEDGDFERENLVIALGTTAVLIQTTRLELSLRHTATVKD